MMIRMMAGAAGDVGTSDEDAGRRRRARGRTAQHAPAARTSTVPFVNQFNKGSARNDISFRPTFRTTKISGFGTSLLLTAD